MRSSIILLLATMATSVSASPGDSDRPARPRPDPSSRSLDRDEEARHRDELRRLEASEPGLDEVRQAALRYAGLDRQPELSYPRRARLSALLPTLTVELDRDTGYDRGLSRSSVGTERLDLGNDGEVGVEVKAAWHLDRLLFSDLELRAVKGARQQHGERVQLLAQITTLYFQRRKLQLAAIWSRDRTSEKAVMNQLAIAELGAQLDTLTGGAFTRMLAVKQPRPGP